MKSVLLSDLIGIYVKIKNEHFISYSIIGVKENEESFLDSEITLSQAYTDKQYSATLEDLKNGYLVVADNPNKNLMLKWNKTVKKVLSGEVYRNFKILHPVLDPYDEEGNIIKKDTWENEKLRADVFPRPKRESRIVCNDTGEIFINAARACIAINVSPTQGDKLYDICDEVLKRGKNGGQKFHNRWWHYATTSEIENAEINKAFTFI